MYKNRSNCGTGRRASAAAYFNWRKSMSDPSKLGARIKKWRENQNMSRKDLAEATGLTEIFITTLEEESLCPSIGPLEKIARALNVRLGTFMDDQISRDPIISRADDRNVDLAMQRARDKRAAYCYHSLARGKSDRAMEPFFVQIQPEPEEDHKLSSHQGEEFIILQSGRLKVIYGNETFFLEPGDTIYYNSIVPHYVGAEGNEPAGIYAVIYNPD